MKIYFTEICLLKASYAKWYLVPYFVDLNLGSKEALQDRLQVQSTYT